MAAHLADAAAHQPESRPVARRLLRLDPGDVVAERVIEFAQRADTSVNSSVLQASPITSTVKHASLESVVVTTIVMPLSWFDT